MVEQLKTFSNNVLALEVIDGFTENDEKLCQKFFEQKRAEGFDIINVLIKLDEMKLSNSSARAFFEDTLWSLRNYRHMGHIAIVAHSKILKALVPIDKLFFQRAGKGRQERYFDVSELNDAFAFVNGTKSQFLH
ncbi:STAS/SEC14 domain-containing protein [Zhouia spongiae]|uniref:STAS/SEC14 domain-containing protein n=1 Tax=Zhouia spongiae TaxID=2202721 RepID=A0ABY3YSH4_9FLAO|nr:STAS/SEC14 domain-containing protein [Zhouia spongiae]UNZ00372.1 STAS/SEC14 domain-containing protein [Zhouia spongiae]